MFKVSIFNNIFDKSRILTTLLCIEERSPVLFQHILTYFIDTNYSYPCEYISELDYYSIDHDKVNIIYYSSNFCANKKENDNLVQPVYG